MVGRHWQAKIDVKTQAKLRHLQACQILISQNQGSFSSDHTCDCVPIKYSELRVCTEESIRLAHQLAETYKSCGLLGCCCCCSSDTFLLSSQLTSRHAILMLSWDIIYVIL